MQFELLRGELKNEKCFMCGRETKSLLRVKSCCVFHFIRFSSIKTQKTIQHKFVFFHADSFLDVDAKL